MNLENFTGNSNPNSPKSEKVKLENCILNKRQ
jgi:hypothetical protein